MIRIRRAISVARYREIRRLLEQGLSERNISLSLRCSRKTIRKVREGRITEATLEVTGLSETGWEQEIDWESVKSLLKDHPLKYIWEEKAGHLIQYSGFWKYFSKRYPLEHGRISVHREFSAGEYSEVDYAGWTVEYVNQLTGEILNAPVFIGILCYGQLIFAEARANMQSRNFLECHALMYESFGGVPRVTRCDCLKQGVSKVHIYDPDINMAYCELAAHYNTAIVPARPIRPKDKALVESAVRILKRNFRFLNRDRIFTSVQEINVALRECVEQVNNHAHTRFRISRRQMHEEQEKSKLQPLPIERYEYTEWKDAKVHPDSHISVGSNYYSVPHIYRGQMVKVKITQNIVEVFYKMERVALHVRYKDKAGKWFTEHNHLPENAKAFYEATPQNLLSQAKFISKELHQVIETLFNKDTLGNLRRVQGIIRTARKEIEAIGHGRALQNIVTACESMTRFNKYRVPYFKELLYQLRNKSVEPIDREITRNPDANLLRFSHMLDLNNQKEEIIYGPCQH